MTGICPTANEFRVTRDKTNGVKDHQREPCHHGGKQITKGGRGQNKTHTTTPATQKERGEEPGGSRGQRERDTPAPEASPTLFSVSLWVFTHWLAIVSSITVVENDLRV